METKIIEVTLGVGMNQLFPETVKIVIDNTVDESEEIIDESEKLKN
jgi:hypothetical protein